MAYSIELAKVALTIRGDGRIFGLHRKPPNLSWYNRSELGTYNAQNAHVYRGKG